MANITVLKGFEERFWARVTKTETCWMFDRSDVAKKDRGHMYGELRVAKKTFKAHRISWYFHTGNDPGDNCVLHNCDNPGCVRPSHLRLGTQEENMEEMRMKGRHHGGPNAPNDRIQ